MIIFNLYLNISIYWKIRKQINCLWIKIKKYQNDPRINFSFPICSKIKLKYK